MSEVCLPRIPMSFFLLSLGVEPSESIALHLHVAYNETPKLKEICNDDYKSVAFLHSILQEFAVVNEVTGTFHPKECGYVSHSTCKYL